MLKTKKGEDIYVCNGDAILCSGSSLISRIIRLSSIGKISHVGMVVNLDGEHILHSTTKDDIGGVDGVNILPLKDFVNQYKGRIYIRRLIYGNNYDSKISMDMRSNKRFQQDIDNFIKDTKNIKYEKNLFELAGAAMPWPNKEDFSTLFCSELLLFFYIYYIKIVRNKKPANEYTPSDFLMGRMLDKNLKYPWAFGPLRRIK